MLIHIYQRGTVPSRAREVGCLHGQRPDAPQQQRCRLLGSTYRRKHEDEPKRLQNGMLFSFWSLINLKRLKNTTEGPTWEPDSLLKIKTTAQVQTPAGDVLVLLSLPALVAQLWDASLVLTSVTAWAAATRRGHRKDLTLRILNCPFC